MIVQPYNVHVKNKMWQWIEQLIIVTVLSSCATPAMAPRVATPTPLAAADVLGAPLQATLQPVQLERWQSPDGRIGLDVPVDWSIESHIDAGRGLWIWNAPGQRGLLSLMLIGSPTYINDDAHGQLLRDAVAQLDAQPIGEIERVDDRMIRLEATGQGVNREGLQVPMWIWVSAHRFADGVAIWVMSVPESDKSLLAPWAATMQASLQVIPLPTVTPLPTATPAPYTKESFDADVSRWFVGDDLRRAITIQDGVYRVYLRMAESYYLSAPAENPRIDQRLQTQVTFDGEARVGVALRFQYRADETRDYVACWISKQQRVGCFRSDGDQWSVVAEISESLAIRPDGPNQMTFGVQNDVYTFAVNGSVVATFTSAGLSAGVPALYVETFDAAAGGIFDDVETS
ncbi:MAG: hypothetical protein RI985_1265 [Chloroflexota bacterium]|jgi:hypothetical protein